ncbi:MAG: DMT family transporter [Acidobacteria bacterium]|nr:DMT family transporter [Acidobacteriota bacterium]
MDEERELSARSTSPYAALLGVQVLFGSLPVIAKIVLAVMPSIGLVGFRVGITAVALFIFQRGRGSLKLKHTGDYRRLATLSLFGVVFNQLLFVGGLSYTRAANTSLLAVTIPIFTMMVGAVIGTERLRLLKVVGVILAAAGVLFLFASVICVPLGLAALNKIDVWTIDAKIWALVFYISIVATAGPYLLNAWALARVSPTTVAIFVYLQPLIGFCLAVLFLGEILTENFAFAAILIFAGVFLTVRRNDRVPQITDT